MADAQTPDKVRAGADPASNALVPCHFSAIFSKDIAVLSWSGNSSCTVFRHDTGMPPTLYK